MNKLELIRFATQVLRNTQEFRSKFRRDFFCSDSHNFQSKFDSECVAIGIHLTCKRAFGDSVVLFGNASA